MLAARICLVVFSAAALLAQAGSAFAACIRIDTPQELSNIRNDLDGDFCLTKDIDLKSIANWAPIGVVGASFAGTLDGRGHVVKNLKISSGAANIGLFGSIFGGTVKNLGIVNARVEEIESPSHSEIGVLTGRATSATIVGVHVTGRLLSTAASSFTLGGLVGTQTHGIIRRSRTALTITFAGAQQAGALVGLQTYASGFTEPVIEDSYATGTLAAQTGLTGGLVGFAEGAIIRSHSAVAVTATPSGAAGGLVGRAWIDGRILDSHATGAVKGEFAGGLVYSNDGAIARSYAAGDVEAGAAGFARQNSGEISQSFAMGAVRSTACCAAGFVTSTAARFPKVLPLDRSPPRTPIRTRPVW